MREGWRAIRYGGEIGRKIGRRKKDGSGAERSETAFFRGEYFALYLCGANWDVERSGAERNALMSGGV